MWKSDRTRESVRKLVHIPGGLLPPAFLLVFGYRGSVALAAMIVAYLGLGGLLAAHRDRRLPIVYAGIVSTRRAEERFPTAAFQFVVAILVVGLLFPLAVFVAAIALLAVGDGVAAIVGRRWGRTALRWNPRKTREGLVAGVLAGAPVAAVFAAVGFRVEAAAGAWAFWRSPDASVLAFVAVAIPTVLLLGRLVAWALGVPVQTNTSPVEVVLVFAAAVLPLMAVLRAPDAVFAAPLLSWSVGAGLAAGLALVWAPAVLLVEAHVNRNDNLLVPILFALLVWGTGRLVTL